MPGRLPTEPARTRWRLERPLPPSPWLVELLPSRQATKIPTSEHRAAHCSRKRHSQEGRYNTVHTIPLLGFGKSSMRFRQWREHGPLTGNVTWAQGGWK